MKQYSFVRGEYSDEIVISRSRFIATVKGELDGDGAKEFVRGQKSKYPDARHNCYAYIAGETGGEMRFSDDGEPQGTAGQPILEVLKKRGLTATAVVVTRYFGGVKLGANGLVAAYSQATANALDKAQIGVKILSNILTIECSYSHFAQINSMLCENGCKILSSEFGDGALVVAAVPEDNTQFVAAKIADITRGKATVCTKNKQYIDYTFQEV